jgi:hypothetical protein
MALVFFAWIIADGKRQNQTTLVPQARFAISTLGSPALGPLPTSLPTPKTEAFRSPPSIAASVPTALPGPASRPEAVAATGSPLRVYIVQPGDSLIRIAKRHGTTVKALRAANDLKADRIGIGQKIKIPTVRPRPSDGAPHI